MGNNKITFYLLIDAGKIGWVHCMYTHETYVYQTTIRSVSCMHCQWQIVIYPQNGVQKAVQENYSFTNWIVLRVHAI